MDILCLGLHDPKISITDGGQKFEVGGRNSKFEICFEGLDLCWIYIVGRAWEKV